MNKTFISKKLVRDKAPQWITKNNGSSKWHRLDEINFAAAVRRKLVEELDELLVAASPDEICSELGDVYELLEEYAKLHDLTQERVKAEQVTKREERGGFSLRIYEESVTVPSESKVAAFCRLQPEKYHEVDE